MAPRRVKVETSVSTLISRRVPRCALLTQDVSNKTPTNAAICDSVCSWFSLELFTLEPFPKVFIWAIWAYYVPDPHGSWQVWKLTHHPPPPSQRNMNELSRFFRKHYQWSQRTLDGYQNCWRRCWPISTTLGQHQANIDQRTVFVVYHITYVDTSSQKTRDFEPMLVSCWASVADGSPTINQHGCNA